MPRDKRIQILTLAHLALGGVASVLAQVELSTEFAFKNILVVPFFALALCQSFLLSLWGRVRRRRRGSGLPGWSHPVRAQIWWRWPPETRDRGLSPGIWTITITATVGSLLVLRRLGLIVKRPGDLGRPAPPRVQAGPWSSIRGTMILHRRRSPLASQGARAPASDLATSCCCSCSSWSGSSCLAGRGAGLPLGGGRGDARPLQSGSGGVPPLACTRRVLGGARPARPQGRCPSSWSWCCS